MNARSKLVLNHMPSPKSSLLKWRKFEVRQNFYRLSEVAMVLSTQTQKVERALPTIGLIQAKQISPSIGWLVIFEGIGRRWVDG